MLSPIFSHSVIYALYSDTKIIILHFCVFERNCVNFFGDFFLTDNIDFKNTKVIIKLNLNIDVIIVISYEAKV
jgi:hypothetical protein